MTSLKLPREDGAFETLTLNPPTRFVCADPGSALTRRVLSAAHVVADPRADVAPFAVSAVDMEATQRYRSYLWDLGLGVAEAMDTAQRGMGLSWDASRELIAETLRRAGERPGALVYSGVGTDHIPGEQTRLPRIVDAYREQLTFVEERGGRVIMMASRALAASAKDAGDYATVYREVLSGLKRPAILHWLGEMFDPALTGYWGHRDDPRAAMESCLAIITENAHAIEGIKVSMLDKDLEIDMRRRLPGGVRMYTGDDFNYPELIAGDDGTHSEALLGIFDAIAPAASAGLLALSKGDKAGFHRILDPTVPLSRELFRAPTVYYKTGVVFLAWLNGHQEHFTMVGGLQAARSIHHFSRVMRLANDCGILRDPEMAADRMGALLALHGMQ